MVSRIFVPIDIYIDNEEARLVRVLEELGVIVDNDELDVFRFKYCFGNVLFLRCELELEFAIVINHVSHRLDISIVGVDTNTLVHSIKSDKFKYIKDIYNKQ